MTDSKKHEQSNEKNSNEKTFNCCDFENMPDMMKNMFSDKTNSIDCKEVMQKMCSCMPENPQKK